MATPTYDLLESVTLASLASSVTFSSIDQSYGDLILVMNPIASSVGITPYTRLNGDTGGNYNWVRMTGSGSSTESSAQASRTSFDFSYPGGRNDSSTLFIQQFMDFSATDKHTTVLARHNNPSDAVAAYAGRWANTSAVTSLTIFASFSDFAAGATFNLYGIAKTVV